MSPSETEHAAVVVTGASSGIGREMARIAAGDGHDVVLVARSHDALEALAEELRRSGIRVEIAVVDLAAQDGPARVESALAEHGLFADILVNNAGFGIGGSLAGARTDEQLGMIDLNVRAASELVLRLVPGMVARGRGGVLNVASLASFYPGPDMAVYYATKAYLRSFSLALGRELRGTGVAVSCLCPGPVRTGFSRRAGMEAARLFTRVPALDAATVARRGWDGLKRRRAVVVPGWSARLLAVAAGLAPVGLTLSIISRLNRRPKRA